MIWYKMSNFIEKHKSTKKRLDLQRLSEVNITYKKNDIKKQKKWLG